jgi:hypothetical protein
LPEKEKGQWYNNKELYEMLVEVSKKLEKTNAELAKTQVMIRDYNGLRERLNHCEIQLNEGHGKEQGSKTTWAYVVGAFGIASFVFSIILALIK